MELVEEDCVNRPDLSGNDSLFERCAWFYAMCREYIFHDHTTEISRELFPVQPPAGTTVLELGCGPGFYACRLAQLYPQINATGLDLSRRLIKRARLRAARRSLMNCNFCHGDAQSLPDLQSPVDAIVISRLFLIVPDKSAVISEVFRALRPGGRCFIAESTSGFRASIPLSCMWLLSRLLPGRPLKCRGPRQAEVMSHHDFSALVNSRPWASVVVVREGSYQYAVCIKAELDTEEGLQLNDTMKGRAISNECHIEP
jgi:arsenite methyltransferase